MKKAFASLATIALALIGGLLTVVPAEAHDAQPGDHVLGHRCRTYPAATTNENTVLALRDTAGVPGAICEIDTIRLSDGRVIVWHDATWRRVADPDTLPAGITPTSRVRNATWAQVSRIRTKGGQPVASLRDMIIAAGQERIALAADIRNPIPNTCPANATANCDSATSLVNLANSVNADVRYYQLLRASCSTSLIAPFRDRTRVGVKILGDCPMTAQRMREVGATFTQQLSFRLTDDFLREANALGIEVGVLDRGMTETTARGLHARGVDRFLLDSPNVALNWTF